MSLTISQLPIQHTGIESGETLLHRLVGCVDGVSDGELRGWIVNCDFPERPEHVVCRDPRGRELTFGPFVYRHDVVEALGAVGVFGFAIPLDLLAPLGSACSVTDRNGKALRNGTEISITTSTRSTNTAGPLKIFLHISKTAGTSIRNTLLQDVPPGERVLIYPDIVPGISVARFHGMPMHQRNRLSWVFGHCKFGIDRYVTQDSRYITFIREPMSRLRSNFAHHVLAGTRFRLDGIDLRLPAVFNEGLSEECDNVLTRVLAGIGKDEVPLGQVGQDAIELALSNVRRHFCFVGQQEQAAADVMLLQHMLKLPARELSTDNVTTPIQCNEIEAVDWHRVAERNRTDTLLYRLLNEECLVSRSLGNAFV